MKKTLLAVIALLVMIMTAACGGDNQIGSDNLTKGIKEGGPGPRLGEKVPDPTGAPTQAALGAETPKPTAAASAPPKAEEKFFDVTLTSASPFYEPGNELSMPTGFTLRVTNKDTTEGRPVRSFEADDGSFSSGPLKAGAVWTQRFDSPGTWKIKDMAAGFIYANLTVS